MKCAELMKNDVECCGVEDSIVDVAARMRRRNVGFIPVCDSDGLLVGAVTDRDLVVRGLANHCDLDHTVARDVMSTNVICCKPDDDLEVAEQLMSDHQKSRIVCIDALHHPVGVISLSDVAERDHAHAASVLCAVAEREAKVEREPGSVLHGWF